VTDTRTDDTPLKFGKYKGKTPNQVADEDPSYVVWMHANVLPPPCTRELAIACEQDEREADDELEIWARGIANE
jgi:uncharacterized protein (DUF3820 family)